MRFQLSFLLFPTIHYQSPCSPFSPSFDSAIALRMHFGPRAVGFALALPLELALDRALELDRACALKTRAHARTTRASEAKKMKHVQKAMAMKMFACEMEQS